MSSNDIFTNSNLATYTKISPNKSSPRNHAIDTITIHCIVGQWTAKQGCDFFASASVQASCNYVVGKDGSIGLCVDESDRSWCSSSRENDNRAVTIEVASDTTAPYAVTDAALKALIELIADICKRNDIKKLVWSTNKADRVGHKNGCNMTVHCDYANKSCPGEYLYSKHSFIANEVNKKLGAVVNAPASSAGKTLYRIRKTWTDAASQIGAYYNLASAEKQCDSAGPGYYVFDDQGKVVYPVGVEFKDGDVIKIGSGAKYTTGAPIPNWVINSKLYYRGEKDNGDIIFSTLQTGAITGVVERKYVTKVEEFKPYLVRVTADSLNIRKQPGTNYPIVGKITNKGVYTIVGEKPGQGATKWLLLKSGAGWISSDYVEKQ